MSDLLPFVSAVLRDRSAVDAQEEIAQLRRELNVARSVEILQYGDERGGDENNEVVVYASGQFQDGDYGGNLWQVDLEQKTTCRLADLRSCKICVGGGIQIESLDDEQPHRANFDGMLDPDEDEDGDNSKAVNFCFAPNTMWLAVVVHGWPRAEWQVAMRRDGNGVDAADLIGHLDETVAVNHPNATVEFKSLSFVASTVHGAILRVLPPRRGEQVQSGRLSNEEAEARSALGYYVIVTIQNRGIHNNDPAVSMPQFYDIMDALTELGVGEFHGNEQVITYLLDQHDEVGRDGMEAIIGVGLEEITRRAAAAAGARGEEAEEATAAGDRNGDMDESDEDMDESDGQDESDDDDGAEAL